MQLLDYFFMYKWFWFEILEYYAKTSLLRLKEIVFHLMLRNNVASNIGQRLSNYISGL